MTRRSATATAAPDELRFVDTHCHLDDDDFASDLADVLARGAAAGVTRWINVGYSEQHWQPAIDLANRFPGMSCMLGVHPGHATEWNDGTHEALRRLVAVARPVAIGEIGLDFFRGETNTQQQLAVFHAQLDLALEHGLPVAIHMRDAEPIMIDTLVGRERNPGLLFHSFDGSAALTDWILANDAFIGVGGLATRAKSHELQRQIRRIPLERIVLETDAPYLVPNGFKHRRNTPESIPVIARFLAGLLERPLSDVARVTTANAERLFERLPHP